MIRYFCFVAVKTNQRNALKFRDGVTIFKALKILGGRGKGKGGSVGKLLKLHVNMKFSIRAAFHPGIGYA